MTSVLLLPPPLELRPWKEELFSLDNSHFFSPWRNPPAPNPCLQAPWALPAIHGHSRGFFIKDLGVFSMERCGYFGFFFPGFLDFFFGFLDIFFPTERNFPQQPDFSWN